MNLNERESNSVHAIRDTIEKRAEKVALFAQYTASPDRYLENVSIAKPGEAKELLDEIKKLDKEILDSGIDTRDFLKITNETIVLYDSPETANNEFKEAPTEGLAFEFYKEQKEDMASELREYLEDDALGLTEADKADIAKDLKNAERDMYKSELMSRASLGNAEAADFFSIDMYMRESEKIFDYLEKDLEYALSARDRSSMDFDKLADNIVKEYVAERDARESFAEILKDDEVTSELLGEDDVKISLGTAFLNDELGSEKLFESDNLEENVMDTIDFDER